ncbi:uncharacterized protein LOC142765120 [Rhipicephalus microplus]|uniref:uncharacterized protein LOC142765120 n=1 Tax=Rhipicephalus microplus TaxID=6941 RepID=UPI003F6A8C36
MEDLERHAGSEQRLNNLLAATHDDSTLTKLREYAQTAWPLTKQKVPGTVRAYWSYQQEILAQDGLVFRSNKRLMGRQTWALLPVPSSHLELQTVPSSTVHGHIRDIRRKQKIYSTTAPEIYHLSRGQEVTTYTAITRTWSPAVFLRPADEPRSAILQTEDSKEIRRSREHVRIMPTQEATATVPVHQEAAGSTQALRRNTRQRREPCWYPQAERRYGLLLVQKGDL